MVDAGWIALGGVAFGVVGKGLWDWLLAVGKVKADREARAEARRDKRAERRDDLQRQTLLDLQQSVLALARAQAKGMIHNRQAFMEGKTKTWDIPPWSDELAEEVRSVRANTDLLRSRVRDASLRELINCFSDAYSVAAVAGSMEESVRQESRATQMFSEIQERLGQLIREMDDL